MTLQGKVALVAGATRGAGRGIATELGAAGATVYVTGRSTRGHRSEYDRPETIEETAELVTAAGGKGIAIAADHLAPEQVKAVVDRIRADAGRLDILVNDIWGGEGKFGWNKAVWEHDLAAGLHLIELGMHTHLITAHHALPLLIETPGGLRVEVTDGTKAYNEEHYRLSPFYDLVKNAIIRMAWAHAKDLEKHGATSVCITPGWLRSEMMLDGFKVTEANWRDAGRRPRPRPLERPVHLLRRPRQDLRLHRPRRQPAGCVAVHRGGGGAREAGGRDGVSLNSRHLFGSD
jgi:NAD(P)-dependent dehydrogenase (short-subunit alcohol dehydrogenase family)